MLDPILLLREGTDGSSAVDSAVSPTSGPTRSCTLGREGSGSGFVDWGSVGGPAPPAGRKRRVRGGEGANVKCISGLTTGRYGGRERRYCVQSRDRWYVAWGSERRERVKAYI